MEQIRRFNNNDNNNNNNNNENNNNDNNNKNKKMQHCVGHFCRIAFLSIQP